MIAIPLLGLALSLFLAHDRGLIEGYSDQAAESATECLGGRRCGRVTGSRKPSFRQT